MNRETNSFIYSGFISGTYNTKFVKMKISKTKNGDGLKSATPFFQKADQDSILKKPFFSTISDLSNDTETNTRKDLPSDAKISFTSLNKSKILNDLERFISEEGRSLSKVTNSDKLNDDLERALKGEVSTISAELDEGGMSINDKVIVSFSIQYSNPEKPGFSKTYSEQYDKGSETGKENDFGIKIEPDGIGTSQNNKTTNKSSQNKSYKNNQNFNVYNVDFFVEATFKIDFLGPIDGFNSDYSTYRNYESRGTLETRFDKL